MNDYNQHTENQAGAQAAPEGSEVKGAEWFELMFDSRGICLTCGKTKEGHPANRHDYADSVQVLDGSSEPASPALRAQEFIPGPLAPFPGLDFSKPLRCKGPKYPVRILAIDYSLTKPIVGVIESVGGRLGASVSEWHINGQFNPSDSSSNPDYLDLENVPTSEGQ